MFRCNFTFSKPTTLAVLTVNLGIHVSGQVLHTGRQTSDPLGIALAVELDTCGISGNAGQCKALFQLVLNGQVVIDVVLRRIHRRNMDGDFAHECIVQSVICQLALISTQRNQCLLSGGNVVVVSNRDYATVGGVSIILVNGMRVSVRGCAFDCFPAIGFERIGVNLFLCLNFSRLHSNVVVGALCESKLVVFVQCAGGMLIVLVGGDDHIAIDHCCCDGESFQRVVACSEFDVYIACVSADSFHRGDNRTVQLDTRPTGIGIFRKHLSGGLALNKEAISRRLVSTVIILHQIFVVLSSLRFDESLVPLILKVDIVTIDMCVESHLVADFSIDLTLSRIICQTNGNKITFADIGSLRFLRLFRRFRLSRCLRRLGGFRSRGGCFRRCGSFLRLGSIRFVRRFRSSGSLRCFGFGYLPFRRRRRGGRISRVDFLYSISIGYCIRSNAAVSSGFCCISNRRAKCRKSHYRCEKSRSDTLPSFAFRHSFLLS